MLRLNKVNFIDIVLNTVYYMLLLDGRRYNVETERSKFHCSYAFFMFYAATSLKSG